MVTSESIRREGKLKLYRDAFRMAVYILVHLPSEKAYVAVSAARKQLDDVEDECASKIIDQQKVTKP